MELKEIVNFLKANVEPLDSSFYGKGYRASVYLKDGTFLPCVIFRNPKLFTDLAVNRFKEEQNRKGVFSKFTSSIAYRKIVQHFVTQGNRINNYDIDRVGISNYAFPLDIQKQIKGETTMGWTEFAAKMKDGKYVGFGTLFLCEFFEMPEAYSVNDIEEIINHSYVLKNGELRSHKQASSIGSEDYKDAVIYRERPCFECFVENL